MRTQLMLIGVLFALLGGCGPSAAPEKSSVERGQYLVENLLDCFGCHSEVDWSTRGAPIIAGKKGAGAIFPEELPFRLTVPNITPDIETGAGSWTDEQLVRAIRNGVGHDGRVLFPIMPYMHFRNMSDEDLASVIAYIRTLQPVRNTLPPTELPSPLKASLRAAPPVDTVPPPDLSTPAKRGEYLMKIGVCSMCHTPMGPDMRPIAGMEFAGGFTIKGPWGEVASANLTPDASGISYYTEETFITALRTGKVGARELNSIMPWGRFRNLTDEDLKAIYTYLRALKPVAHRVDNTEPPTDCRVCGGRHGLGEANVMPGLFSD